MSAPGEVSGALMPIIELHLRAVGWELDYAHAATLLATFQPVIDAALKRRIN